MCAGLRRAYPALRLDSHVLDKREVENYFPREVLLRRNRDATTDIWDKFDEEQKDFNDLKEIYTQKLWKVLTDPQHDGLFHEAALRDRGGPELDKIVDRLIAALS